ncbi:hypothetical protein H0H92_015752 [Tricholoma furcatifolium]|nr:hypothetical protein H0H92_015752 [Tricholoma furcatifolium]
MKLGILAPLKRKIFKLNAFKYLHIASNTSICHASPPSLPARTRFRISYKLESLWRAEILIQHWSYVLDMSYVSDMMEGEEFSKEMSQAVKKIGMMERWRGVKVTVRWSETLGMKEADRVEEFQELAAILSVLGTSENLPFKHWHSLSITLPRTLFTPFDPQKSPVLPIESFTNLRNLSWQGHSKQILHSWFPITATVLKKVETLDMDRCDITPDDVMYIMRYATNVKELRIWGVSRPPDWRFYGPPGPAYPDKFCLPFLERLSLSANFDICPLLESFQFPLLRSLTINVYSGIRSDVLSLDVDWNSLKVLRIFGYFTRPEEVNRIYSKCSPNCDVYITR